MISYFTTYDKKCYNFLMNAPKENIVTRIEEVLVFMNKKKQDLCSQVGITPSALWSLHKTDGIPVADKALKIAEYLGVSVEWLIFGKLSKLSDDYNATPAMVYDRIYKLLLDETNMPNPDFHSPEDYDMNILYAPVKNIVSSLTLENWSKNRNYPDYMTLSKLAKHFHKSFAYIAYGYDSIYEEVSSTPIENGKVINMDEYKNYCLYKEHNTLIWTYTELYDADKKVIQEAINRAFRLRLHIEGRDWDYSKEIGQRDQRDINQ